MDGSYPGKLRVWEAWKLTGIAQPSLAVPSKAEAAYPAESAVRWYARETLTPAPSAASLAALAEPYTLPWFLQLESRRHERSAQWLPRLLEFEKHAGEKLLGLGGGLGTDWARYAACGASVLVCNPSADELALARRNFELRGLTARFLHADPAGLPLENASLDVVCVGDLPTAPPLDALADEIHRVLKPGGKVLLLAPARRDIDHWTNLLLPWQRWLFPGAAASGDAVARFTGRELRRHFSRFTEHRVHKRHLRRSEVPHLWRWLPLPMLERWFGHFLILKAFKPLSTAMPVPVAA